MVGPGPPKPFASVIIEQSGEPGPLAVEMPRNPSLNGPSHSPLVDYGRSNRTAVLVLRRWEQRVRGGLPFVDIDRPSRGIELAPVAGGGPL